MKLRLEMTTFTQVYSMYLINFRCSFLFLGFYSWEDFNGTRTNILNSHSNFISYWSSLVTQSFERTPCGLRNVVCWTNGNQIPWNVFGEMWSPYVQRTDTQTHTHTHTHTEKWFVKPVSFSCTVRKQYADNEKEHIFTHLNASFTQIF